MILFIDDEPRIMDSYRLYLERQLTPDGYQIAFYSNVDEALEYFESHLDEVDLIILDIMMPPGERFSGNKTNGGLKTGLFFYEKIRESSPDLPVVIFTNFSDESVEKRLRQDRKCRFLQKADYLLDDFVSEVRKSLSNRAI